MVSCVFSIGLHQIVAFAAQENLALFAFLEFFESHHVHGAHGFDARLHFVVTRFGGDQFFADQQLAFLRHQFFGLRVQFGYAGLAQIIAVGIVARFFDLALASLRAKFVKRLPFAAQRFVELAGARTRFVPFLFERCFQFLRRVLFPCADLPLATQAARKRPRGLFSPAAARRVAGAEQSCARPPAAISSDETLFGGLRAGKALGHRGQFFAPRHHLFLERLEIAAQL